MIEQGVGHVVNTASIAGLTTTAFLGPYHATNFAVVAMSEALFKDLQLAGAPWASRSVPGFVQTRIAGPTGTDGMAPERDVEGAEELRGVIQGMVDAGISPAAVADRVIDAVRTDTFYILTHPELNEAIETRTQDILQGRPPSRPTSPEHRPSPSGGARRHLVAGYSSWRTRAARSMTQACPTCAAGQ